MSFDIHCYSKIKTKQYFFKCVDQILILFLQMLICTLQTAHLVLQSV